MYNNRETSIKLDTCMFCVSSHYSPDPQTANMPRKALVNLDMCHRIIKLHESGKCATDGRLLHKSTINKLIVHFKEVGHCLPMFTVKLKQTKGTSEVADIILAKIGDDKKAATAPR